LLDCTHLTGIEGYPPSYERAKQNRSHHELVLGDIRQLDQFFQPGQFDACIASDVIEHLHKEEGHKLIRDMERIASKKVIFTTPSGFLPQGRATQDDLQTHHSGWDPSEMRAKGYRVVGLLGPKKLRGAYHEFRFRPKIIWGLVALIFHLAWTRTRPDLAAALLACKTLSS